MTMPAMKTGRGRGSNPIMIVLVFDVGDDDDRICFQDDA